MFLVRWTCRAISLPLVWAGRLAAMFKSPAGASFLKAAWAIGGDGTVAQMALSEISKYAGAEAARAQGQIWMARSAHPQIASFTGLLACNSGDIEAARDYLVRGREHGDDPSGLLELLEFVIAARDDRPDASTELAERLSQRTDLSPAVSKMVLTELLWASMLRGEFGRAREHAERLVQVESNPPASIALWALAEAEGDRGRAERHLADAHGFAPDQQLYYMCLGSAATGRRDEAIRSARELRGCNEELAELAERFLDGSEAAPCP